MKIGIIGLGLIGGCLGIDFRKLGHKVYGLARRQQTCDEAISSGIVDVASTDMATLRPCDVVFVCTPIATILPMVAALSEVLEPRTIVTDVGSVKSALVVPATEQWPRFVGGHPMSGKSEAGLSAASAGLFRGNAYVITPVEMATAATDPEAVVIVEQLAQQIGSRLYHCSPSVHDRAVAWISHLPVMVSSTLIHVALSEPDETVQSMAQHLASSGFRDTSRVGGGNPELGVMMARYNRVEVLRSLKQYQRAIAATIETIETENWDELTQKLNETQRGRPAFLSQDLSQDA
ncbi:MAG: prephenate/arogenate dehydrogenase [Cyanobacteria bacterium J06632_3]